MATLHLAILILVNVFLSTSVAQAKTPNTASDEKISKLENQVSELEQKLEGRTTALGTYLLSGVIAAAITAIVTLIYKRREASLLEDIDRREAEDRKAQIEIERLRHQTEKLQNDRVYETTQTQLKISRAQTAQSLIPALQSDNDVTKRTALELITFLGDRELAATLSSYYDVNIAPAFRTIASTSGLPLEERRKAAAALGRLGERDEARAKLLQLSEEPDAQPEQRFAIAKELENLGDTENAARTQLELILDPNLEAERWHVAVEALRQLGYVEKAKTVLSTVARNEQSRASKRIRAIEALWQLDSSQQATEEWATVLSYICQAPAIEPRDLGEAIAALRRSGHSIMATKIVREIAHDPERAGRVRRFAAYDLGQHENRDEAADVLRAIADDKQTAWIERQLAAENLVKLGYSAEGILRKQRIAEDVMTEMLSKIKNFFRRTPSS